MSKVFCKPENGYKLVDDGIPDNIWKLLNEHDAFKYPGSWIVDATFLKSDNEFIVTVDNGGFYKVGAAYMVWHMITTKSNEKKLVAQAIWTDTALKKTLKSLMKTGTTIHDPNYQT